MKGRTDRHADRPRDPNTDQRSQDYGKIAEQFRPGHADFTYFYKYGLRDHRGGGRASARLTAPRSPRQRSRRSGCACTTETIVRGHLSQMGEIEIPFVDWALVDKTPFFIANADIVPRLEAYLDDIRKDRDSVGAKVRVIAENVPIGLGEPLYDKLDADIAYAMMGINAVKGVEIGAGFASVAHRGSMHGDEMTRTGFRTNNAGGVLGGISTSQNIEVSIAIKPTSSIATPKRSPGHPR
jgi:chorismate synthase